MDRWIVMNSDYTYIKRLNEMKSEPSSTKTLYRCAICKISTYRITSKYNLCNRQSGDTIS